jgi:hypothetical protein
MQWFARSLVRRIALTAGGVVLALIVASSGHAWGVPRDYLTFSGSVALPAVVLPPGSYIFEVANLDTSGNVVHVSSRNGGRIQFLGFTRRMERPRNVDRNTQVTFGEAAPGTPVPIRVWYPSGSSTGYEFIYRR